MDFLQYCIAVRQYGMMLNAYVTSWGRSAKHNKAVGGVEYSAHRFWMGLDVGYDDLIPEDIRRQVATRLGLKLVIEGDHDHIQPIDWIPG